MASAIGAKLSLRFQGQLLNWFTMKQDFILLLLFLIWVTPTGLRGYFQPGVQGDNVNDQTWPLKYNACAPAL